jgi:hypothetical protein
MSWDVDLVDDREHLEGSWNYTHNVNGMIAAALDAAGMGPTEECGGPLGKVIGPAWWDRLDGLDGPTGAAFLKAIADELDRDPATYDQMNPSNGWGDRGRLVALLREMIAAVPEWPCTWEASG